ncbi:MAG TPA: hypothetical protein VJ692_03210 [Nitrospiraceae bacterium]|nr:hypothetical protein [Nitrospiraceae bacterium]
MKTALQIIQQQIAELEAILKQAEIDLNTVAGSERIAKWKKQTSVLLGQVDSKEAQRFSALTPGSSFTNDMLEELNNEAEPYRDFLTALAGQIKKQT